MANVSAGKCICNINFAKPKVFGNYCSSACQRLGRDQDAVANKIRTEIANLKWDDLIKNGKNNNKIDMGSTIDDVYGKKSPPNLDKAGLKAMITYSDNIKLKETKESPKNGMDFKMAEYIYFNGQHNLKEIPLVVPAAKNNECWEASVFPTIANKFPILIKQSHAPCITCIRAFAEWAKNSEIIILVIYEKVSNGLINNGVLMFFVTGDYCNFKR